MSRLRPMSLPVLLAAASLVAAGCGGKSATQPAPDPLAGMPAPTSPSGVLRALEWAVNHRSIEAYRSLFTGDFVFRFSTLDTAGILWGAGHPWGRAQEQGAFTTLVQGGDAGQPAATACQLQLDRNFIVFADPRPGMNDPVRRRSITTQVNLTVTTSDGATSNVYGSGTFYVVRGDIAVLPPDLGLAPDSTRWYIGGWDDNTIGTGAVFAPMPTKNRTWGDIKVMYLPASLQP